VPFRDERSSRCRAQRIKRDGNVDSKDGFRLTFSANPFPGFQKKLTWLRGDSGGNYYKLDEPPIEGWICAAMFRYYKSAPKALYVMAEPKRR
jgi:hypothetical protein